ncbi:MAG: DUF1007 family protein [Alkalilacustris sp.]
MERGLGVALATALLAVAPGGVVAHPHVFIDTGVEVIFDSDGRAVAVQIVWVHDEFYTMLSLDDFGMDPDFTGTVTDAEREELAALYSNWDEGFNGDLRPLLGGRELGLGGPTRVVADVQDARLVIAHRRNFDTPVALAGQELVLRVYDPTFFISYTIASEPVLQGRDDCTAEVWGPDWEAADARLQAALDELLADGLDWWEIEADFPAVGADFAEEVRIRCPAPS